MQISRSTLCLMISSAALTVAGCYSYYPNGYGGYPGPYNSAQPPGAYSPGGPTFQPPPGTTFVPQGALPQNNAQAFNPQPAANVVQPQPWQPASPKTSNSTASPFDTKTGGDNLVPDPREPADLSNPESSESEDDLSSPFGFNDNPGTQLEGIEDATAAGSNDKFVAPIPLKSISSTRDLPDDIDTKVAQRPSPYNFDRTNYRWLRGTVDYDQQDKSWHIIYDIDPGDKYGGSMTLAADERLDVLKTDDVILVEGRIDPNVRDRLGKPSYRVDNFSRLVPKP